ncbi:MAG: hypothetical protein WDW38_001951 [Sanguina aurantia]
MVFVVACVASCLAVQPTSRSSSIRAAGPKLVSNRDIDLQSVGVEGALEKPNKKKKEFKTPSGLFIQERASKQLPGPGQHFSFGALLPWAEIQVLLDQLPDSKLVLLIRHGQAISNYLSDFLGPDEWFKVEETCAYTQKDGTEWGLFDADLTVKGQEETNALNGLLDNAGWYSKLTGGRPTRAVVSPLSRCLETANRALSGLPIGVYSVEENVRETLGEDTCDARRSVSNPDPNHPSALEGPCDFAVGLRAKFPQFEFPIVGGKGDDELVAESDTDVDADSDDDGGDEGLVVTGGLGGRNSTSGFGLLSDRDGLWTHKRETQHKQVKRATRFLRDLYAFAPEKVVFVVTHSGFTRSVLLAAGREPYRPQNSELVPLILQRTAHAGPGAL